MGRNFPTQTRTNPDAWPATPVPHGALVRSLAERLGSLLGDLPVVRRHHLNRAITRKRWLIVLLLDARRGMDEDNIRAEPLDDWLREERQALRTLLREKEGA